jgi:hypothetical protein
MDDSEDDHGDLGLIEALVVQLLEGVISQTDRDRLNELLLGSIDGRRVFLQYAQVDAGLHWIYAARKQVAAVIDGTVPGGVRPIADVAQQQLRFADDPRFIQVMQACSSNESHAQDWLQLFPRVLAVTSFCIAPTTASAQAVQAIVDKVLVGYTTEMSSAAFWASAMDATYEVTLAAATGDDRLCVIAHALLDCAFASPEDTPLLDAISIHEILDECIPHRLPADTLRVLYLRYLHGMSPRRIGMHLNRSVQHVQLHLAKVRVHLVSKCLTGAGADARQLDVGELLLWSRFVDASTHDAIHELAHASRVQNSARNATHLLLLAFVHDYLGRGLSPKRLLDEIPSQKDKSYLRAVEQSFRDIETLGETQITSARAVPNREALSKKTLRLATMLGVAACLFIVVGAGLWMSLSQVGSDILAVEKKGNGESKPAAPPKVDAAPVPRAVELPVVAVISEAIGISSVDSERLTVGSMVRMQDVVGFEHGIVQIATTSGSTLILEGPVDAQIGDKNRILLRRGKITGLNKSQGESLIIDSPKSSIVDVGTEFGVSVTKSDETVIAVYEGEVRLESPSAQSSQATSDPVELKAGWEARIEASADIPSPAIPLVHERAFVRADEVQLRKEAKSGNFSSAAKVAFYDLLRVDGLIAYQGFHEASSGAEFSLGFRSPEIRQEGQATFGSNILKTNGRLGPSNSLAVEKDVTCYLDLDLGEQSRSVRTNLVDENGLIGIRPGELWLCWRTKAYGPPGTEFSWAGLSLMYGDERSIEEPLFIGQPAPLPHLGFHVYAGRGEPLEVFRTLDKDANAPGEQPRLPDFNEHVWLLRLRMNGTTTDAAVWCDAHPEKVANLPPGAVQTIQDFRFDRLRFEAHSEGENGGWLFDDIIVASSSDTIAAALQLVTQDAAQPNRKDAVR